MTVALTGTELLRDGGVGSSMVVRSLALVAALLAGCGAARHDAPVVARRAVDADRPTPNLAYFPPAATSNLPPWDHDTPNTVATAPPKECTYPRSPDAMDQLQGALRRCYQSSLADPECEGKVTVAIELDPAGRVLAVRATHSTVPGWLEACAVQAFASQSYSAGPAGCVSTLVMFAVFQRQRPSEP